MGQPQQENISCETFWFVVLVSLDDFSLQFEFFSSSCIQIQHQKLPQHLNFNHYGKGLGNRADKLIINVSKCVFVCEEEGYAGCGVVAAREARNLIAW